MVLNFNDLQKTVQSLFSDSTTLGYIYVVVFFILRVFPTVTFSSAFGDELKLFQCSSKENGCVEVCHNEMVPFSLDRLMQMKLFMLTLPTVVWYVVTQNEREKFEKANIFKKDIQEKEEAAAKKLEEEEMKATAPLLSTSKDEEAFLINNSSVSLHSELKSRKTTSSSNAYFRAEKNPNALNEYRHRERYVEKKEKKKWQGKRLNIEKGVVEEVDSNAIIEGSHLAQIFVKIVLELVFLYVINLRQQYQHNGQTMVNDEGSDYIFTVQEHGQFWLWQVLKVPIFYICGREHHPNHPKPLEGDYNFPSYHTCQQRTSCWSSRSTEKTYFLQYMIAMSFLSILLLIADLIKLSVKTYKNRVKPRREAKLQLLQDRPVSRRSRTAESEVFSSRQKSRVEEVKMRNSLNGRLS